MELSLFQQANALAFFARLLTCYVDSFARPFCQLTASPSFPFCIEFTSFRMFSLLSSYLADKSVLFLSF